MLDEDPEIYDEARGFVEAGDWVVQELTGVLVRNACGAGYKALWSRERGFPSPGFFGALDPRFRDLAVKLPGQIVPPGRLVGGLRVPAAERLGLRAGTAVAAAIIDAHSAVPAATVVTPGRMVMVLGTSTCHMLLADRYAPVEGIAGIVADGIVEGFHGYEAGQPAVGDLFAWFVSLVGPAGAGFENLEREAADAGPGSQGLMALDWWNGNRSVLANADLSGLIVGLTLRTAPAHIYRSLIEATGFGTRRIIGALEREGIQVGELIAAGGIADRSPLLLQIYANITGRPIRLAASRQTCALGAAMLGAVAAGEGAGGHATLREASGRMARLREDVVAPERESKAVYEDLYREYLGLHDYFGRGGTTVMTRLRRLRRSL
jgi:L-ribulokinase